MEFTSPAETLNRLEQDRYFGAKEAARYLGICERTLRSRLAGIPHYRTPKIVFRKRELDDWMEQFRQLPERDLDLDKLAEGVVRDILRDQAVNK